MGFFVFSVFAAPTLAPFLFAHVEVGDSFLTSILIAGSSGRRIEWVWWGIPPSLQTLCRTYCSATFLAMQGAYRL